MTTDVISAAEAWEAVERLKLTVSYGFIMEKWYATQYRPETYVGIGATPLEAVGNLLAHIGEAANKTEAANG